MFNLTEAANAQIKISTEQSDAKGMALRVAATKNEDGTLHYGMGFDKPTEDDALISCDGVNVVISPTHIDLLKDCTVDYVELEPGKFQFIFLNPADPNFKPAIG